MRRESQPATQLSEASRYSTSTLRGTKEAYNHLFGTPGLIAKASWYSSRCLTCRHILPSKLEPLLRCSIPVSRSVRPTKVQKGGRCIRKAQWRRRTRWLEMFRKWLTVQLDQCVSSCCFDARISNVIIRQTFPELQSPSNEQAKFFPQTTKNRRRLRQKNKITAPDIPYENFKGSILGGRYQLQCLRCREDNLDIYSVTSLCGLSFEAQAFSLSDLPEKQLQARKRRMKRLHQSKNFICEITQAGKRFLIIDIERSDAEWKNLVVQNIPDIPDWISQDSWMEDFPDLSPGSCRKATFFLNESKSEIVGDFWKLGCRDCVLIDRRTRTRSSLLVHRVVSIRCLAARVMRKLLRWDWRMTRVLRLVRALNNGNDEGANGVGKIPQSLLPHDRSTNNKLLC
jgi:hypothetical protein